MQTNKPVVLVTGASSGIGEAIANKLVTEGYKVYGTSRRGASSGQYPFPMLALDVTDDASVAAAIEQLLQKEGRIDVLVNNAGFGIAPVAAEESSIEQAKVLFDTNFLGVVRMTHAVVPQMRRQGSGRIINMSSILGVVPMPYAALYVASKHAVEGLTKTAALEGAAHGVRVNAVAPGPVETGMLDRFAGSPDNKAGLLAVVPAQRAASADEIAQTIVFVASNQSPYLTGQSIAVDGGFTTQ